MTFPDMATEQADRDEHLDALQKQIAEWQEADHFVSPKDDEYRVTFVNDYKDIVFTFRARNNFQALRNAYDLFEDLEVWHRVYTTDMHLDILDHDGKVLASVLTLTN